VAKGVVSPGQGQAIVKERQVQHETVTANKTIAL
jgi:hypothetical protein